jgi:SAM-dependent methyltransferase
VAGSAPNELSRGELRQQRHFDVERNQYARAALVAPPVHTVLELERVVGVLRRVPIDGPVVDFGAGTGRLSLALAKQGYSVIAHDLSRSSLDVLDEVAEELGLLSVTTTDVWPEGEYSAVVGADVLHHVDMDEYVPRLRSLLRPGGKAVFSEPGALNPAWYVYLPARRAFRAETGIVKCTLWNLRRTFLQHGFADVSVTGLGVLPRVLFRSAGVCGRHDRLGNRPVLRWVAYRYVVEATA